MRAAAPSLADCEFAEFLWARAMVSSRAFSLLSTEALVPMADMLDHQRPADVEWGYEHPTESFTMRAARDIAAGEVAYDSYGEKSNGKLLELYGFCVDDPRFDDTVLQISSAPDAATSFRVRASEMKEETDAVALLRRAIGSDRTAAELTAACDRALAAFPTTMEDDEAMLVGGQLTDEAWSCVRERLGEKRVLRAVRERYS
jgi:protein-histidine N-methyltransferase